jgi:broad specificity phosphatase PhoE
VRRLLLVRHAATSATRDAAFPADEPLDDSAHEQASGLASLLPSSCKTASSPALRCLQTAAAAGLEAQVEPGLAECDFGSWSGRTLAAVHQAEPEAAREWMSDPHARPHGGESLSTFASRVASWLDAQAHEEGCGVAITHAGVIRTGLVHALGAPIRAFWQIEVAPLTVTELHAHEGRWMVVGVNRPASPEGSAT